MPNHEREIEELKQVRNYYSVDLENISDKEKTVALSWFKIGAGYYNSFFRKDAGHKVTAYTFQKEVSPREIQQIIDYFSKKEEPEEEKEQRKPVKEDSTVPAELETLVALYKEEQANQLEVDTNHSVASAVIRARKTWAIKHQADLIRENRLALIQDKSAREKQKEMEDLERDLFLVQTVDPKAESAQALTRSLEKVSRQAVIAQAANLGIGLTEAQISKAVDDLTYLGLSGAIDPTNFQDLNIVSQLAFRNLEGITINSPINKLDDEVKAWQEASEKDPYSDKPDEIEKQINLSDGESQKYFSTATKSFQFRLKQNNIDLADDLESAQKELLKAQSALLKAIPNAALPSAGPTPLHQNAKQFETLLRQADPSLRINPDSIGAQVIGLLQVTKGENRNISPEAVRLYSLGLDASTLDNLIKNNPNSNLTKFIGTPQGKNVYQQVHYQLGKIGKSKLGKEIKNNIKPLGGISESLAGFYNRNPAIRGATAVLNPVGTLKSWAGRAAGRRIGQHLIENSSSLLAKKLGSYLVEHGLQNGIKAFSKAAAKQALIKAATWAALKLGISLTAESLNAIMPGLGVIVDIAAQIILYVGEKTIGWAWNQFKGLYKEINGKDFEWKDALQPVAVAGAVAVGAAVSAGAVAFGGFIFIVRTAQIAIVSAVGIIIAAVVTMGLYLGFTYLVAPMLSTLVQLDSVEKVDYSQYHSAIPGVVNCANVPWPFSGKYPITQGPQNTKCTHHGNISESADFGVPLGTPILSMFPGKITFAGNKGDGYGNHVIMTATTDNGKSFTVIYGHFSKVSVSTGQTVEAGKPLGLSGNTGYSTGPHLHLGYIGVEYNSCPAGGHKININCCTTSSCNQP